MVIEGELNMLVRQPVVGPWEPLLVKEVQGRVRVDADAILDAICETKCLLNSAGLEKLVTVQLEDLDPEALGSGLWQLGRRKSCSHRIWGGGRGLPSHVCVMPQTQTS